MTFTSTPTSIIPPFTQELDMICELWNVPDVIHVVSIGITRGEQRIASISDYHAAQADVDQITVEGNVTGTTGSYLKVEWSHPDMTQVGEYRCDITVIYTDGHPGRLEADLEVKGPTLQDLVKVLIRQQEVDEKLEDEITKQEEVDTKLEEEITKEEEVNTKQEEEITKQKEVNTKQEEVNTKQEEVNSEQEVVNTKQEEVNTKQEEVNSEVQDQLDEVVEDIKTQQTAIDSLTEGVIEVTKEVAELDHIETGLVACSGSDQWTEGKKDWPEKTITRQFSRPFANQPATFSSIRDWATVNTGEESKFHRIGAYVSQVNTTHITVKCFIHKLDSLVYSFLVNWMAMAQ